MPPLLPKKIKWFVLGLFVGSLCTPAPLPNSPAAIPNVPLFRNVQDNNNSFQARGCPFVREQSLGSRVVTAYSSTVDQCDSTPFITANGERVDEGTIACPRYIPFGTIIKIDEEIYICNDRMNTRYAHRFDIWFASREEATEYGKQIKEIIQLS